MSGCQWSSWSQSATSSASAGTTFSARSKLRYTPRCSSDAWRRKRGSPPRTSRIASSRSSPEASSLITQTQFSCVCSRIDSICLLKSPIGGRCVVIAIAMTGPPFGCHVRCPLPPLLEVAPPFPCAAPAVSTARETSSISPSSAKASLPSPSWARSPIRRVEPLVPSGIGAMPHQRVPVWSRVPGDGIPCARTSASTPLATTLRDSIRSVPAWHVPASDSALPLPTEREPGRRWPRAA